MPADEPSSPDSMPVARKGQGFPSTDWSNLSRLRGPADDRTTEILNFLSSQYWSALYEYVRCRGFAEHEAQDLTQEFFAFAFETRLFAKADRTKGRFRSFLLGALRHFVENHRRKASAAKRRPPGGFVPLDEAMPASSAQGVEAAWTLEPEAVYHRVWMRNLVDSVLARLAAEFRAAGRTMHVELFVECVVRPIMDAGGGATLEAAAHSRGLDYKTAANRVLTAKRAFRRLATVEVGRYALDPADLEAEEREVLAMLKLDRD